MHKVPFARLVLVFVLSLFGAFADLSAQSPGGGCENPGEFDFTTQVCPNGQGSASSRYGPAPGYVWDTYQWTVTGGTIISGANSSTMHYTAGPSGTVEITLAVTSASCSGTKTHTAVITPDQTADIHSNPTVCPYSRSSATVMYGDSSSTYAWSITNGTFVGPTSGSNVQFIANGSGSVGLDVMVSNASGCNGVGHLDIPITAPALAIDTYGSDSACPSSFNYAVAMGDLPYGTTYWWTADNAQVVGSGRASTVEYVRSNPGPVTLHVTASTPDGCTVSASRTVTLPDAPVPELVTNTTSVCPTGWVTFTVPNIAQFPNGIRWEYTGANYYDQTANSLSLSPNGSSEIRVTVFGQNPGCETSASMQLPVRDPDGTIAAPAAVCPNADFTASVPDVGSGGQYSWSFDGPAMMVSTGGEREVTLRPHGPGTIRLSAWLYTSTGTCTTTGVTEIQVGSTLTPTIHASLPHCGTGTASVDHAANYTSVAWSIQNGVIDGPANGPTVTFHATSSDPVVLTAAVTSANGCSGSGSTQVTPRTPTIPAISASPVSFCSTGSRGSAQVTNGPFAAPLEWRLTNAVIVYRTPGNDYIEYRNAGEGPVVIEVSTRDAGGCAVTGSTTIPYQAPRVPVIAATPAAHCGVSTTIEAQVTNAADFPPGTYSWAWYVKNGYIVSSSGPYATIQPTSSTNPVEITAELAHECLSRGTVVVQPGAATATPPTISFSNPDVCPNGPGSAWVPSEYSSYSWSIQNGTLTSPANNSYVYFSANGAGPVQLSVAVGSADSCPVVSTASLPLRATDPPLIEFTSTDVCPNGPGTAYTMSQWAAYSWSIVNGTFTSSPSNSYVYYSANGNGPVQLTLQVWTSDNCTATATASQPLRTTDPPLIEFTSPSICPNGPGTAYTMSQFAAYSWSIVNGTFTSSPSNSYVYYAANGNGPVELTLQAWTSDNCTATSTASQQLRSTTPPLIELSSPNVCPNGPGTAYTMSEWAAYSWSIVNGTFTSSPSNSYVYYTADGNGPVELTLQVWTNDNCTATGTASQPLSSLAPPTLLIGPQPSVCAGGTASAYVPEDYASYSWSVQNGTITGQSADNKSVMFTPDGSGNPLLVSVQVTNANGCTASNSATVPLRSIDPPVISVGPEPDVCPGGTGSAYVAYDYASYDWSIQRGTITSTSADGKSVMFTPDGSGPVVVSVTVTSSDGCSSSNSATVPLRSIDPPVITTGPEPDICPAGTGSAYVPYDYDTYTWSIQNGTITSTSADRKSVMFTADGSGPVTVSVQVSLDGCTSSNSVTFPLRSIDPPAITTGPEADICPAGTGSAYVPYDYESYTWSIQNGTITTTSADRKSVMFTADGSGPVTVSVQVSLDGCTSSNSVTFPLRSIDPPVITTGPEPDICPAGTGSAYVPYDYDTYTWSIQNGTITTTSADRKSVMFTADGSGPVIVSVQVSLDGCTSSNSVTIPLRAVAPTTIAASGPTTFCEGGSVTLTASDAASYQWSNGATTQSITVSSSGSYSVTATGSNGCTSTSAPVQVTVDPAVSATITSADSICEGSTGTASVADAGAGAQYQWSATNGAIVSGNGTPSIVFSADGSASVQLGVVVTRGTCSATGSKSVAVNPRPVFTIIASPANTYELREGDGDETMMVAAEEEGSSSDATTHEMCGVTRVSLRASVLNGSWTYTWSNGATGPMITVTENGSYTLTATSASGCVWSETANVVMKPMPVAAISGSTTFCPGGSTTLTASGGESYLWSTGATTPSITVSTAGTYSVQVTQDGCTATASANVTQSSAGITADGPTTFCHGGSVTLTANPAQSYLWSNGATTQSITVTSSGTFTVQETFDGCTLTSDPVAVTAGPESVSIAVDDNSACPGQTMHFTSSVTGGSNLTYQWLDGNGATLGTGATLDFIAPQPGYGSVSLRVTDANGCQVDSQTVTYYRYDPPKPTITPLGPSTTFCEGGNVTLEASLANSYLWSTGETTRYITVSTSGSYSVTTTDGSGCATTSDPVTVTVLPRPPQPAITASGPLTFCEGGSVTLTGPDGYSQYLWSTGETTRSITVSTTRQVALTVINEYGCDNTNGVYVEVNPLPPASITASGPTTFCEGGSVTLTAPDGYSYAWSNGATTQSITVAESGAYSVTVTNANGCSATSAATTVTVNPPPATPAVTASGATTFCEGGSVTLTAPSGYSYAWSNGATTQSITVTASGSYSVTVTNASGCSATSAATTVTVNPLPAAPAVTSSGATTFCEGGSVTLTAPEGYSYAWSNGATTQSITVATSGSYSVTVTNASGCSATSAATTVTVNPPPATPTVTASGATTFCEGGSVTLSAPEGYSYAWSNGATTQSITVTASGSYSVTVTNANGCSATSAATTVTVNPPPATPTVTASGATTFCEGGSVTLTAPAGYSYAWSNGATTQSISVAQSGSYSVTVTNANGCSATSAATVVTVNPPPATPTVTASGATTFCEGGSVTLTAPAGYSYLWSNGATTQSITATASGSYSVTVTNANGCSATSAATVVTVNPPPATPTVTASGATTFCEGGSVTLTAPSGYTYTWSNGATTQSITVTASGSFSVTVTNTNGCSATSAATTVTVNPQPATPTITASGATTFCEGGSVTLTAPAGYTYAWSNGATTQSITVTASGSYSVTVTNANGCSATSAATTVTVNPQPATPAITASGSTALCPGASVTLTAPDGYTYLWSNGATTQSITVSAAGSYSVTVTNANGCSATSAPTGVTTNPATSIVSQPQSATISRNTPHVLSVTATGTAPLTYQWYQGNSGDTSQPLAGQTSSSLSLSGFSKKGTYRYWVHVSSATCTSSTANSTTAVITVN